MQPHFVNFATSTPKRTLKSVSQLKRDITTHQTRNKIDMS